MYNSNVKNKIIIHICFFVFIFISICYSIAFSSSIADYHDNESFLIGSGNMFTRAINSHDYFVYLKYIEYIESDNITLSINNNTGIAYVYFFLKSILGAETESLVLISMVVNVVVIYFTMLSFCKVVYLLGLSPKYYLLFFINGSLLYFSQLINKDVFTLFIFTKSLELVLCKKYKAFYWLIPLSFIVRIQLVPFLILFLYLSSPERTVFRFWLSYLITAIAAGLVAKYVPLIGLETMKSGLGLNLNLLLIQLNQEYIVASAIFNPIRVLQYFVSIFHSLSFTDLTYIDIGKIKDIPQIIVLIMSFPFLIKSYLNYKIYSQLPSRVFMAQISAFFMVWLINPTTNGRYILVLIPTIAILAAYLYEKRD